MAEGERMGTRRPRDRKRQIVLAATELFHQRGYDVVAVNDVAAAVGITGPALYRHFGGKQELLRAVVFSALDRWAERVAADGERVGSPADALCGLLGDLAHMSVEHREFGALWQRQSRHLRKDDRAAAENHLREIARVTADRIRSVRPGLAPADATMLGWAVLSVGASLSYHHVTLPPARLERLVYAVSHGLVMCRLPRRSAGRQRVGVAPVPPVLPTRLTRRAALLAAAADLFDRRGYQPVSIEEIGAAAGVSAAAVYRHYASKADLLHAVLMRGAESLHAAAAQAQASARDPADALTRVVRAHVAYSVRHSALAGVLIREAGGLPDEPRAAVVRTQRDYVARWVHLLCSVRDDMTDGEARLLTQATFSVVSDVVRTPHLLARPGITGELTALAHTVLRTPMPS